MPVELVKIGPGKRDTIRNCAYASVHNKSSQPIQLIGIYQTVGIGKMMPIPRAGSAGSTRADKEDANDIGTTGSRNNTLVALRR